MAEGKHTPGPWAFDQDEMSVTAADGADICSISAASDFPCLDPDEDDTEKVKAECLANGLLIAALPEFYEALVSIGSPEEIDMVAMSDAAIRGWAYAAASVARGALAKAEVPSHG